MKQEKSTTKKSAPQTATYIVMTTKEVTELTKSTIIKIEVDAFETFSKLLKSNTISLPKVITAKRRSSNEEIKYDCTNYETLISSLSESNLEDYILITQSECSSAGNKGICTTEYTFGTRQVPIHRNRAKLFVLEIYNRKTSDIVISETFVDIKALDTFAYEYYRSDYEGRKYDYYINGVNMNGYFHYLTRGAYDVAYKTSLATSSGVKITIDKTYKSVIPKLGLVSSNKDENPEFACCFCEKTFSGKRNKHSVGGTRPKTNAEGIPNYCCTGCFKKYVVPMIAYAYKLRFVRGLPGYEDVPRDEKEIFASIQKMSPREMQDIIKRENIAELMLPILEMLAHAEENRGK